MPILKVKFNYAFKELNSKRNQNVGVYLKNGKTRYVQWLGFIDLEDAKALQRSAGAIPVKIDACQHSKDSIGFTWLDIPRNHYAQVCLTSKGVYGVTEASVRIVKNHPRRK